MERNFSVSVKGLLVAAVIGLALVVAFMLGSGRIPAEPADAAGPEASADAPIVRMVGEGTATVVPDEMAFTVSAGARRDNLADAMDAASRTMQRTLNALKEYGVTKADTQTTGLNMYPVYEYQNSGPRIFRGYRVRQTAEVVVKDLAKASDAIPAAVKAGGNGVRVRNIRLRVSDLDAALAEARDAAVADATAKATRSAEAAGRELGQVISIQDIADGSDGRDSVLMEQSMAYKAAADLSSMPVRAGKDELAVRIELIWSLS